MNKKLLTLAIAGALALPFAASADMTVYGVMHLSFDNIDVDNPAGNTTSYSNGSSVSSNSSRIGFKGAEDLGGGMKAVYQIESGVDASESGGALATRNTFVGLAGGFGTVLVGRHDTPYKLVTLKLDPFGDTIGDYNAIIGSVNGANNFDLRLNNVVAWISPTWGGVHVAAAWSSYGAAVGGHDNDQLTGYSLAAVYDAAPFYAALAYEVHGNGAAANSDVTGTKLGIGASFGPVDLGVVYEKLESDAGNTALDRDALYVSAAFNMGAAKIAAAYGKADDGASAGDTAASMMALGAFYNLSKSTKVYAAYAKVNNDGAAAAYTLGTAGTGYGDTVSAVAGRNVTGLSLGIVKNF